MRLEGFSIAKSAGELQSHIRHVAASIIREGHKKKVPGPKVVEARKGLGTRATGGDIRQRPRCCK